MGDKNDKPALDEQTFARLLEAAYVLQEHNRKVQVLGESLESQSEQLRQQDLSLQTARQKSRQRSPESSPNIDYTVTLAEIVEAQHQIQMRHLDLEHAMAVVAERVTRITGASGAGIGLLDGATVRYRAASGSSALPVGTEVPLQTAICQANVRTGQVIRTDDVDTEFLFDPEPCRHRGILSLVAVPIYHDGNIIGALELYFDRLQGYAEQDIHTCQLMAGLVTEAIGRDADSRLKKSLADERSSMLAEIERLQPKPSALARVQTASSSGSPTEAAARAPCWKCGNQVLLQEQFCGRCGAPRGAEPEPVSLQSKLASAWHMQQASQPVLAAEISDPSSLQDALPVTADDNESVSSIGPRAADDEFSLPWSRKNGPFSAPSQSRQSPAVETIADDAAAAESETEEGATASSTALIKPEQEEVIWTSAAKARDFLESISAVRSPGALARFWHARKGDFYLAVALILIVVVIRWGIWSNHSVGAQAHGTSVQTGNRASPPAAEKNLSTFDKLLISLGLAEPPETPEDKGNPETQVWVDLQSAQYYCPGADLYGKTSKGKYSTQRDAQLDQFEPAYRKACE